MPKKPAQPKEPKKPAKIATTIHLQKLVHNSSRKSKAQRAVKEIVKAGQTVMSTPLVKIDQELNTFVWQRSRANPPVRVRVLFERKADEKGALFTLATLQPVASFAGLKTEKIAD
jgi:large subunit ribosomal protein L31e